MKIALILILLLIVYVIIEDLSPCIDKITYKSGDYKIILWYGNFYATSQRSNIVLYDSKWFKG